MAVKCGNNTIMLERPVHIINAACIVGQKELKYVLLLQ